MFKKILLPVDLQENALSQRAIDFVKQLSQQFSCDITVMTVIPDFGMPLVANFFPANAIQQAEKEVALELQHFVDEHFDGHDDVRLHVDTGSPHKAIVKYAEQEAIDLIVLPALAKDMDKLLLGSTSTHVAEHANCSVMVIRS